MIPKVIHYIWVGGKPLPPLVQKCINSWKKYCPDYEIKRWDESNFDINECRYIKEAYSCKKWAFVSDYMRFKILYENGGFYLDTDVELLKPLDDLLEKKGIFAFENETAIAPGLIMGCEKNNEDVKRILDTYIDDKFILDDGLMNYFTICQRTTQYLQQYGLVLNNKNQQVKDFTIYSSEYFSPMDYKTKNINITEKTYSIHWYDASWISKKDRFKAKIVGFIKKVIGKKNVERIKKLKSKRKEK